MNRGSLYFFISFSLIPFTAFSQCPTTNIILPDTVCAEEIINIINNSIDVASYEWDFCAEDNLEEIPLSFQIPGSFGTSLHSKTIKADSSYHTFIPGWTNDKMYRLDYGDSIFKSPFLIDLGNPGNILEDPAGIDIIAENDNWYALVTGYSSNSLYRLTFGNSLQNVPIIEDISGSLNLNLPMDIKIIQHRDTTYAFIVNNASGEYPILRLNFGNSILNMPAGEEISIPGSSQLTTITFDRECDQFYGFIISRSNKKIFRLHFNNSPANSPSIDDITAATGISFNDPAGITAVSEGNNNYTFINSRNGPFYRLDFGSSYANTPVGNELGNINGKSKNWGIQFIKQASIWVGIITNFNGEVYRYEFGDTCPVSIPESTEKIPQNKNYELSGNFTISLNAYDSIKNVTKITKSITVLSQQAPFVDFTTNGNACLDNITEFTGSSPENITLWSWDFGDGFGDGGQIVSHQFLNPGEYPVKLSVEAENGCTNAITDSVKIYSSPIADFSIEDSILCSNDPVMLINQTTYNSPDSIITFSWNINDEIMSVSRDTTIIFTSEGNKFITLSATIPGCTSDTTKTFSILEGPNVYFTFSNVCDGEPVLLNNESDGDISAYFWDLGDGYTSTLENPTHLYETGGNFNVSLSAIGVNGCLNSMIDTVIVHHLPNASFQYEVPCSRSEILFIDESSVNNANITHWEWLYLNMANPLIENKDSIQNPVFIFQEEGEYRVSLKVLSNFGCMDSIGQIIQSLPTPVADFMNSKPCIGDSVYFTDISNINGENIIDRWTWNIDNTIYNTQHSSHLFTEQGEYVISLTVQADNLCRDNVLKTVTLNPLPSADFLTENNCQNETILFESDGSSLADPIVQFLWDIENAGQFMGQSISVRFEEAGVYQISHIVLTENGCMDTLSRTLPVYEAPVALFDYSPKYGNIPLEVSFENKSSGADNYLWDFDHDQATSEDINSAYTYEIKGYYYPKLVAESQEGCKDSTFVTIYVADPILDVTLNQVVESRLNGKINYLLEIINSGTIIIDQMDIIINVNGEISVNETFEDTLYAGEILRYPLQFELIDLPNLNQEYICFQLNPDIAGFEEYNTADNRECLTKNDRFLIRDPYPNPTNGDLNIDMIIPVSGDITVQLISSDGKIFWTRKFNDTKKGLNVLKIKLDENAKGVYLLRFSYNNKFYVKRIVVIN